MATYIGNQPTPQATQTRDVFTATAGQTTFATSGYTPNYVDCWLNGIKLVEGEDFTAANGSDIVLTSGAAADDVLEVVSLSTFEVARHQQTRTHQEFTATAGQTTFTVGSTYVQGAVEVFINGLKLNEVDFTAINGTDVILAEACVAGDEVVVIWYGTFDVADAYTKAESDNRYVNVAGDTMTGGLTVAGLSSNGVNTIVNPSGTNYNENIRLPRASSGYVSICMGTDPNATSGLTSGQVSQIVYPTDHSSLPSTFAIRRESNDVLRIDTAGQVTLPYQPIISGQIGTAMTSPTGPQKIAFNQFWVSRGISYNSSDRRFTVSVAGQYRITMNPFKETSSGATRVLIGINNDAPSSSAHYGHAYSNPASTYVTMALNSVVTLAAGDYIVFYLSQGTLYNQNNDLFNQFTIEKIA